MEDKDALLQLKKRARRRLVGAIFLAGSAVFLLNMAMNDRSPAYLEGQHEPKIVIPGQDEKKELEIRIPEQDQKPFAPRSSVTPQTTTTIMKSPTVSTTQSIATPVQKTVEKQKPTEVPQKPAEKPTEKPLEKPVNATDASRAAAILAGKTPESASAGGLHVILIGAFTNQANVKNLQSKLGQLGIKVYTEPLDTPQGKKTRVRAGPFSTKQAGEVALQKMKSIGVSGVLTTKQ